MNKIKCLILITFSCLNLSANDSINIPLINSDVLFGMNKKDAIKSIPYEVTIVSENEIFFKAYLSYEGIDRLSTISYIFDCDTLVWININISPIMEMFYPHSYSMLFNSLSSLFGEPDNILVWKSPNNHSIPLYAAESIINKEYMYYLYWDNNNTTYVMSARNYMNDFVRIDLTIKPYLSREDEYGRDIDILTTSILNTDIL